jgi:hypothetical protein
LKKFCNRPSIDAPKSEVTKSSIFLSPIYFRKKSSSSRFAAAPENEYAMLSLARGAGIQVPRIELIDIGDIRGLSTDAGTMEDKALAVQRFDRGIGGEPIRMEDFAQVFGLYPDDEYRRRGLPVSPPCCGRKPAKPALTSFCGGSYSPC